MRSASVRRSTGTWRHARAVAPVAALALLLAACGGAGDDAEETPDAQTGDPAEDTSDGAVTPEPAGEIPDGPEIVVGSFNFPESTILAEVYGQTLEDAGYPVGWELDLGTREGVVFPALFSGEIDLVPEYLGSALVAGFGLEPPTDVDSGVADLREAFGAEGVEVLEPAPAENTNAFVTTSSFAEEHGVSTLADLAEVGPITFAGPPECEERDTCLLGLTDVYGLDVQFQSIQEPSARLAALEAGDADLILLFSTDAVLADPALVQLEDTEGVVPPENIVPVVNSEVVDVYRVDLVGLINTVSAAITTETLIEFNTRAGEGVAPDQIAADWLAEQGFVE